MPANPTPPEALADGLERRLDAVFRAFAGAPSFDEEATELTQFVMDNRGEILAALRSAGPAGDGDRGGTGADPFVCAADGVALALCRAGYDGCDDGQDGFRACNPDFCSCREMARTILDGFNHRGAVKALRAQAALAEAVVNADDEAALAHPPFPDAEAFARAAHAGRTDKAGQPESAWPSGCTKPNACARHRGCVYALSADKCRHFGKDLTADVEAAVRGREARNAVLREALRIADGGPDGL